MSKCGSCDLYEQTQSGIYCEGNLGDEDCARKLQEYIRAQQMEYQSAIRSVCELCTVRAKEQRLLCGCASCKYKEAR